MGGSLVGCDGDSRLIGLPRRYLENGHLPDAHADVVAPGHVPEAHCGWAEPEWAAKVEIFRVSLLELQWGQAGLARLDGTSSSTSRPQFSQEYSYIGMVFRTSLGDFSRGPRVEPCPPKLGSV